MLWQFLNTQFHIERGYDKLTYVNLQRLLLPLLPFVVLLLVENETVVPRKLPTGQDLRQPRSVLGTPFRSAYLARGAHTQRAACCVAKGQFVQVCT